MRTVIINFGYETERVYREIVVGLNEFSQNDSVRLRLVSNHTFTCDIFDLKNEGIYLDFIASKLADFIVNVVEPRIITEEVKLECQELFDDYLDEIIERVMHAVSSDSERRTDEYVNELRDYVYESLTEKGGFHLGGFINFTYRDRRLGIKVKINEVLDDIIDSFNEREELTELMGQLMTTREPQTELIHVVVSGRDRYGLITGDGRRIDMGDMDGLLERTDDIRRAYFIMNVIALLLPRRVVIHTRRDDEPYLVHALEEVMGDGVVVCYDCNLCNGRSEKDHHDRF